MRVYVIRDEYTWDIDNVDNGYYNYSFDIPAWQWYSYVYAHRISDWIREKLDRFPYELIHAQVKQERAIAEAKLRAERLRQDKLVIAGAYADLDGLPRKLYSYSTRSWWTRTYEELSAEEQEQVNSDGLR